MTILDSLHHLMRYSHIAVGFAGLALFWVPVFAHKGGRLHIGCGRVFVYCAYYGGATGLIASIWALVHPASFVGDSSMQRITAEELPYAVERARFLFSITGFLALAVLAGTAMGVRIVRTRQDHAMLRTPWLLLLLAVFGLWSLALTVYGGWSLLASYSGWHLLPPAAAGRYWISLSLGLIGVYGTIGDLRYIKRPRPTPMAWWYRHMECMLGAGIGFHAAFFVFGASRLLKLHLQGVWQLLPWLLPFAIGVPAMMIWIRHYERKFEGAAS